MNFNLFIIVTKLLIDLKEVKLNFKSKNNNNNNNKNNKQIFKMQNLLLQKGNLNILEEKKTFFWTINRAQLLSGH